MDACARAGECELAFSLFEEMQQLGFEPNVITFNAGSLSHPHARPLPAGIFSAYRTFSFSAVFALLADPRPQLHSRDRQPRQPRRHPQHCPQQSFPLTSTPRAFHSPFPVPGLTALSFDLSAMESEDTAAALMERALELLKQMKRLGIHPNTTSYNRCMTTSQRAKQFLVTLDLYEEMASTQVRKASVLVPVRCTAARRGQQAVVGVTQRVEASCSCSCTGASRYKHLQRGHLRVRSTLAVGACLEAPCDNARPRRAGSTLALPRFV